MQYGLIYMWNVKTNQTPRKGDQTGGGGGGQSGN